LIGALRWSATTGGLTKRDQLEPAVAVWRAHHRDLDMLIAKSGDTSGPFSFDRGPSFELKAEFSKEIDCLFEVVHDDPDVVHAFDCHMTSLKRRPMSAMGRKQT